MPNAHMWVVTTSTPSILDTLSTSAIFHDVAVLGCSNRKYRFSLTWSAHSFMTHLTWSFALSSSRRTMAGSRRATLIAWSCENAVHMGEHTSMYGLPSLMRLMTLVRTLPSLRSHGVPVSGSFVVRSNDHPGRSRLPAYDLSPVS